MYTLITGASGFIGTRLAQSLVGQRPVICFSRHPANADEYSLQGEFHSLNDLRQLDNFSISCVVHLGAVTGGCSEEDGLAINVLGTRRLIRYLADRGCCKFLLASSIAAVGCLDPSFVPLSLPIPDEHPCLARDAYGFSKSTVEELTRYFSRVNPDLEFSHFRFGVVVDEATWTPPPQAIPQTRNSFAHFAQVMLDDVIRALTLAIDAPLQSGVHVYNVVGPDTSAYAPVSDLLKSLHNPQIDQLDLSWYSTAEHQYDALYSMEKIKQDLGFVPRLSTRTRMPAETA
jgi:UDP-glucose 4-epimerase